MVEQWHFEKDPDSLLDFGFGWTRWLNSGDYVTASNWVISPAGGLTAVLGSQSYDNTSTVVRVEGGVVGEQYTLVNSIETHDGLKTDRTLWIHVVER